VHLPSKVEFFKRYVEVRDMQLWRAGSGNIILPAAVTSNQKVITIAAPVAEVKSNFLIANQPSNKVNRFCQHPGACDLCDPT
jgi:hypothetical protein